MASAFSPPAAASSVMASAMWQDLIAKTGAGPPDPSPTALDVHAGTRLRPIGGAAQRKRGMKSGELLAALDDVARRARDALQAGLPTASGAEQQASRMKRSKEPNTAADVLRQGVGLAVSRSLPRLTRQESSPEKGRDSNIAADVRQWQRQMEGCGQTERRAGFLRQDDALYFPVPGSWERGPTNRVLAALDDVARRARDALQAGPPTASGAGQQESKRRSCKESTAAADVPRQGVGFARSKNLPSLTRQEASPEKGKDPSIAADVRQWQRRSLPRLSQQRRMSEHRLTTVAEVWELLTCVQGTYGRTMTVGEFVDVFRWARDTGLDTQLALTAPVTDENGIPGGTSVEEFLPIQVGRLCELILDGDVDTLTDGEVWLDMAITKSDRLTNGLKDELLHRDLREREIRYKQFCRIIPTLARALSLDMQVVLSHISWLRTRVFEAPAPLLALFVQQCANHKSRQRKEEAYRGAPDVSILDVPFSLVDHVKLCRNGQAGLLPGGMQDVFYTVVRRLHERLAARMEIRKEANPRYVAKVPTIKKPGDDEQDTFVGAEAFQVLIEELFKVCPAGKFVSPLAMLVHMIRQGTENPLVSEETIEADAALARRLTLADS